jgi:hypothetical protein
MAANGVKNKINALEALEIMKWRGEKASKAAILTIS